MPKYYLRIAEKVSILENVLRGAIIQSATSSYSSEQQEWKEQWSWTLERVRSWEQICFEG